MGFDDLNDKSREFIIAALEELDRGNYDDDAKLRAVWNALQDRWSLSLGGRPVELDPSVDHAILAELENFEYILSLSGVHHIREYSFLKKAHEQYGLHSQAPTTGSKRRFTEWWAGLSWGARIGLAVGIATASIGLANLVAGILLPMRGQPWGSPPPTPLPPSPTAQPPAPPPDMEFIPAGEFTMGSSEGDLEYAMDLCLAYSFLTCNRGLVDGEYPQRSVFVGAFYIDIHEVTNAEYLECVQAGPCEPPQESSSWTRDSYYGNPVYDDYPVIHVSWYQADTYCQWAGKRLPTEAEWEKAARGTDGLVWPWGDQWHEARLNCCANARDTTRVENHPGGASPYGLYDLAGNVSEWVADWYDPAYYKTAPDRNPAGASSGRSRVQRGGSWQSLTYGVRAANRRSGHPESTSDDVGFRCAK